RRHKSCNRPEVRATIVLMYRAAASSGEKRSLMASNKATCRGSSPSRLRRIQKAVRNRSGSNHNATMTIFGKVDGSWKNRQDV
ncbi:MAG: hypothetical protein ACKPKO_64145, partial [Candidatus Fonsibacter sp.]